jgi:hypothetical protein
MSLQSDARDCLLAAIAERNHVNVPPDQMGSVKPSDPAIGAQDGLAWQETLQIAAECLRKEGHPTGDPTLDKANSLVNKTLTASQLYLVQLSSDTSKLLLVGGAAAAVSAVAIVTHFYLKRQR